jgi:hypothetical protein
MKRSMKMCALVLVVLTLGFGLVWLNTGPMTVGHSQPMKAEDNLTIDPFPRVNYKARVAKNGDPQAVQELGSEVVNAFSLPDIPTPSKDAITDRVVRSELSYRKGGRKGITETDVVNTINEMADKLGAPDYAKTRRDQVRILRVGLMTEMPDLIDQEVVAGKEKHRRVVGEQISEEMSPVEATAVTMLLLHQKLTNPEFQVGPNEFVANWYQRRLEQWQAHHDGVKFEHKKPKLRDPDKTKKKDEMRQVINNHQTDLSSLADSSLDTLGIDR